MPASLVAPCDGLRDDAEDFRARAEVLEQGFLQPPFNVDVSASLERAQVGECVGAGSSAQSISGAEVAVVGRRRARGR